MYKSFLAYMNLEQSDYDSRGHAYSSTSLMKVISGIFPCVFINMSRSWMAKTSQFRSTIRVRITFGWPYSLFTFLEVIIGPLGPFWFTKSRYALLSRNSVTRVYSPPEMGRPYNPPTSGYRSLTRTRELVN